MSKQLEAKNIDELLAEADELVRQINTDTVTDLEEEHRLEIEKHALELEKIKSGIVKKGKSKKDSGAEGMHEAILDIVKAMQNFKNKIF